jgi:preprotein translocase subunit SecD
VQLIDAAREDFSSFSRRLVGQTVSIKIDGLEVGNPKIQSPLLSGKIVIPTRFGEQDAGRIARGLPPAC